MFPRRLARRFAEPRVAVTGNRRSKSTASGSSSVRAAHGVAPAVKHTVRIPGSASDEGRSRAFDYETFFRNETEFRLRQGMYDYFLPLHSHVGSATPHQALAAPELYRVTDDVIPPLDKMLEGAEQPSEMLGRLKQLTNGLTSVTVFATTDYLGLSAHPLLIETAKYFTRKHGVSCTGSRYITGNSLYQQLLERECAAMHTKESALLFLSCFDANNSVLSCLGSWMPGCIIYSDESNHASIVEGIQRSGCEKRIFRHCDPNHLQDLMKQDAEEEDKIGVVCPKLVVFESVYSMTGNVCPVPDIIAVAKQYGALTFIDEAHSLGLYGRYGRGLLEEQGCEGEVDIVASTLGKATGFQGGYISASLAFTEAIRHKARGFVFTSTLTPAMAATGLVALRLIQTREGQELRKKLFHNVSRIRQKLDKAGIPVIQNDTHIIPVCVHDSVKVHKLTHSLLNDHQMYVTAARSPAVPRGKELLRVVPQPHHTEAQISKLVEVLVELWNKHDLPFVTNR